MSNEVPRQNNSHANRCAIYARSATAHQANGLVNAQVARCREFAAGLSEEHPALNELLCLTRHYH
jgi:predicted site-specific integrase-resolvase